MQAYGALRRALLHASSNAVQEKSAAEEHDIDTVRVYTRYDTAMAARYARATTDSEIRASARSMMRRELCDYSVRYER